MARLSCYEFNMLSVVVQVDNRYNSLQLYRFLDTSVIIYPLSSDL